MLSSYNEINNKLCAERTNKKSLTLLTVILFNSIIENNNVKFLIPNYVTNRNFTKQNMGSVKENCL